MTAPATNAAPKQPGSGEALLQVEGLQKHFPVNRGIFFQKQVGAV